MPYAGAAHVSAARGEDAPLLAAAGRSARWSNAGKAAALTALAIGATTMVALAGRQGAGPVSLRGELDSGRAATGAASRLALSAYFDEMDKEESHKHEMYERVDAQKHDPMHLHFDGVGRSRAPQNVKAVISKLFPETGKQVFPETGEFENVYDRNQDYPLSFDDEVTLAINHKEKVQINLYMESMCPGCQIYSKLVLAEVMKDEEFLNMAEVKVVPYGNGALKGDKITCQHGSDECLGNAIISCMQKHYPVTERDPKGFIPAFSCLMDIETVTVPSISAPKCCVQGGLDYDVIRKCAYGEEGKKLSLAAARETEALEPAHKYSPWVTINGQPLERSAWDLVPAVCAKYKGPKGRECALLAKGDEDLGKIGLAAKEAGKFTVCERGSLQENPMP